MIAAVLIAYGTASAQVSADATITVNTLEDPTTTSNDGKCSLREAIYNAVNGEKFPFPDCAAGSADAHNTINFAKGLSGKITLDSELPAIDWPGGVTIDGRKAPITVSGNNVQRVFSVSSGRELTLKNLTVADGNAGSGGGISNGGTLKVLGSTFSQNTANNGGGIYNNGTLTVTNSTFSGNSAQTLGGGIFNNTGAQLTVTNSTFFSNTHGAPERGGGISNGGTATLKNTIVVGSGFSTDCSEGITDGGYNLDDDGSCVSAGTSSTANPKLNPNGLRDNGGPTQTIALLKRSPAINAIPKGANGCGTEITKDQRGVQRPQGSRCDIGAYEKVKK